MSSVSSTSRRSDARRNRTAILTAAAAEIERRGSGASLEDIARLAGVGSATLHRHFPTRRALVQAVFHDRIAAFGAGAAEFERDPDAAGALRRWFDDLVVYSASTRGLVDALNLSVHGVGGDADDDSCEAVLLTATEALLVRARSAGSVRSDVSAVDLLTMMAAIAAAAPDPRTAGRLMDLVLDGAVLPAMAAP